MFLDELFNFRTPESRDLTEPDARQEWPLAGYVIVDPTLADTQPFCDIGDGQQTIMFSLLLATWRGALQVRIQTVGLR